MTTQLNESLQQYFGQEYQGIPLTLQILGEQQWLLVLQATPIVRLRLSAESDYTRQLDQMGFSDEAKIGNSSLDDHYVIRAETSESRSLLSKPEIQQILLSLHPFLELELTHKDYRLIKDGLQPTIQIIESLLPRLHDLIKATQIPEGTLG